MKLQKKKRRRVYDILIGFALPLCEKKRYYRRGFYENIVRRMRESMSDYQDRDYEDVCIICHRPESKTGKMFHLPNNISVCKTFEMFTIF